DVLCSFREQVVLQRDPVDGGLNRRIEELDDEDQEHARDHERLFRPAHVKEKSGGNEHDGEQTLLPERVLVPEGGRHALQGIAERVPQAPYPGLALEGTLLHVRTSREMPVIVPAYASAASAARSCSWAERGMRPRDFLLW